MIKLIAAVSKNGCIGNNNELVVHNTDDMNYFKMCTLNNIVVMGMGTWKSIGKKPLENRLNIVVTNQDLKGDVERSLLFGDYNTIKTTLRCGSNNYWVIGGEQIYRKFLQDDLVDEIHLTRHDVFIAGDAYFPMELLINYQLKYKRYYKSIVIEIYQRIN